MNNGLKPAHQQLLISIISHFKAVEQIILFGSRAINTFRDNSDIDLVLLGPGLTIEQQAKMLGKIEQTSIPYTVDLLLYHHIANKALIEHIEACGVLWFER